jgi:hypothetical protein
VHPLALLVLLAATSRVQWSETHGIGISVPQGWKVLQRDRGARSFVIEGPVLGEGIPHVEIHRVTAADAGDLATVTSKLLDAVTKRPGWTITARKRKRIGPWPAERVGLAFTKDGIRGRARFTVAWIGSHYFALEMSASAKGFPGGTFDRMEQSLQTRWTKRTVPALGSVEVPAGWTVERDGTSLEIVAPGIGATPARLRIGPAPEAPPRTDGTKAGPKLRMLGKKRTTLETKEPIREDVRAVLIRAEGWQAVLFLADTSREEVLPVFAEILDRVRKREK